MAHPSPEDGALTGKASTEKTRPANAVVAPKDQKVKRVELKPNEK